MENPKRKMFLCIFFIITFAGNLSADIPCSPSEESKGDLIKKVAYYTDNDRVVIRFLQRESFFNFEMCLGSDGSDFQVENFDQFSVHECKLLSPKWVSLSFIDTLEFKALFLKSLEEKVEGAKEMAKIVNKAISYARVLDSLALMPLILTESALVYLSYKVPNMFPSRLSKKIIRHAAWLILIYVVYDIYQGSQIKEEVVTAPDHRAISLERFIQEQNKTTKALSPQMLSTEANKLIYLLEESLTETLAQLESAASQRCGALAATSN